MAVCATPISPWVDMEATGQTMDSKAAEDPIVQKAMLLQLVDMVVAPEQRRDPLIAPLYGDLSGLPPLLIQVGTEEVLYDDAVRLAGRAVEAHIDVTLECWDGMFHVWHAFYSMLDEGQEAIAAMGQFYKDKIGR